MLRSGNKRVTSGSTERSERVSDETNLGRKASVSDGGVSVVEGRKHGEVGKHRKNKGRGKIKKGSKKEKVVKVPWSKEERKILWKCLAIAGGRESEGYIPRMLKLWEERGTSRRSQASLISQVRVIERGGLSNFERQEIESRVREETRLRGVDFVIEGGGDYNSDSDDEVGFVGFDSDDEGVYLKEVKVVVEDCFGKNGEIGLTDEEKELVLRMKGLMDGNEVFEVPNLKAFDNRKLMVEAKLVDRLIGHLVRPNMTVTDVNRLLSVGSYIVADRLGMIGKPRKKGGKAKPHWQRRLERSIADWRKDLSQVDEIRRGVEVKRSIKDRLERKYSLVSRGTMAVSAFLKNKVQMASTKIRWYVGKCTARRQNNLFRNNQSQLYKELGGTANSGSNQTPNTAEAKKFWESIWSADKQHNESASWMDDVRKELRGVRRQEDLVLQLGDVKSKIGKMANWKAPGPDGVRGFWFKRFPSLHSSITASLQEVLESGLVPDWMVKGRTILIQKDSAKGTVASNYRPIACLPLMWKLLTGIVADKIYDHLMDNKAYPEEQKGCKRRSRGTKDQLLIDKTILRQARAKQRNLSMAWIDYKKAYDMVPHSWIREMLGMLKVAGNVQRLLSGSMADWKTVLTCNREVLGEVDIKRGIFQGDSLSPYLFIIAMIPLSILLRRENKGYAFGSDGKLVNHLLFMDDLKLYGKSESDLEDLIEVVSKFSKDIGMEFGLDKCGVLVIERGVKVKHEGIKLPDGKVMKEIDDDGYKYLGILEGATIMNKEMKVKVWNEYLRRVKCVAKSRLYAGNLIKAINVWAVSVIRYSAGILEWSTKYLQQMDIDTRKALTLHGAFHRNSTVNRLYMKRNEGGRGLLSVECCVRAEEIGLSEHVLASDEWMLKAVSDTMSVEETKKDYLERVAKERKESLMQMKYHGQWLQDVEGVADERSWQWVKGGFLSKGVESFVFAAQEKCIGTRYWRGTVGKEKLDMKCRVCGEGNELVPHLTSSCSGLRQREFKRRHDRVGLRVYWELCRKYGLKVADVWYKEVPDEVRKSDDGKIEIWWDKKVETAKSLECNRPDVVVFDKRGKKWECLIVDFAVPWDANVLKTEKEKISKYAPLAREMRKQKHSMFTKVIPIVVGCLGVVSRNLSGYLETLDIPDVVGGLQTSAIIGTQAILKKVLSL